MNRILQLFSLLSAFSLCFSTPAADLVVNLPGLNYQVNFDQYSGYLDGDNGRFLHYWLTESQNDSTVDPLVLWLNGGPGCSSLMGLLTELGPFRLNENGTELEENPYAWNTLSNVLFLEAPACVGFSYQVNDSCRISDNETASSNYAALKDFFVKFPEYRNRDFYITGESYAGIYIPTLALEIVQGNDTYPINFKGYAIGNPIVSYTSNSNSLMFYGYYHGLFGEDLWNRLINSCCNGDIESQETCDFVNNLAPLCETAFLQAMTIIDFSGINAYNLYGDCEGHANSSVVITPPPFIGKTEYDYDIDNLYGPYTVGESRRDPPCTDSTLERNYLNDPAVRTALNIPPGVQEWKICSDQVNLLYIRNYINVRPLHEYLVTLLPGMIYSGDTDMACNFLGSEWDVEKMGLPVVEDRRTWSEGGQVAGFVKRFQNFDFVTVRGSGHMVPEYKPGPALKIFSSFINGQQPL